jgi:hypothetical protein
MKKKAPWILPLLAALFLVPPAWAKSQVVGLDGTVHSVEVAQIQGEAQPGSTALSFSVLRPNGTAQSGVVSSTEDLRADRDPSLELAPGGDGPFLVWTRHDGLSDQIAYSRYRGNAWDEPRYLTSDAKDHVNPQVGVDGNGMAYVVWVEPAGGGSVMFATFDPHTGDLFSSPRDLFRELVRHSPAVWLTPERGPIMLGGRPTDIGPVPAPEGGNDTPAIPPCSNTNTTNCKKDSLSGGVFLGPSCTKAAAAVVRTRGIWIGVLENGEVLAYYRSVIPAGAPEGYVELLLQTLLSQHCQP